MPKSLKLQNNCSKIIKMMPKSIPKLPNGDQERSRRRFDGRANTVSPKSEHKDFVLGPKATPAQLLGGPAE